MDPERDGESGLVANRELLALPEPADGDLFFNIEGARYYSEDGQEFGLQYLFGVVDTAEVDEAGQPRYTQIWAFDRPGERQRVVARYNEDDCRATLALRDWLEKRRAELGQPGSHPGVLPDPAPDDPGERPVPDLGDGRRAGAPIRGLGEAASS